MAKLDVPPTKSSLLRLKRDLRFAREGYEMLEEKRQILILELMGTVQKTQDHPEGSPGETGRGVRGAARGADPERRVAADLGCGRAAAGAFRRQSRPAR